MNTINVNAIANSHLQGEIEMRRGHVLRSYFKRQSRRQVRQRLEHDLRTNMAHHLAEAVEMMSVRGAQVDRNPVMVSTAKIIAFPSREQRPARSVLVVRKSARSPFERKQMHAELLAA
ncbi:hypothetical protein [Massilia aerilata]|uniref:Uncharacterized protein n=1 Tax=Massilia aerilata TaxID=453817 RepID=A0ABW0S035_9BURK